jgi:hypothetical protein
MIPSMGIPAQVAGPCRPGIIGQQLPRALGKWQAAMAADLQTAMTSDLCAPAGAADRCSSRCRQGRPIRRRRLESHGASGCGSECRMANQQEKTADCCRCGTHCCERLRPHATWRHKWPGRPAVRRSLQHCHGDMRDRHCQCARRGAGTTSIAHADKATANHCRRYRRHVVSVAASTVTRVQGMLLL